MKWYEWLLGISCLLFMVCLLVLWYLWTAPVNQHLQLQMSLAPEYEYYWGKFIQMVKEYAGLAKMFGVGMGLLMVFQSVVLMMILSNLVSINNKLGSK